MGKTSVERLRAHLTAKGAGVPVQGELRDDLENVVRRCDEIRGLGQGFGSVELSPYLKAMLRVSGLDGQAAPVAGACAQTAAAGV